MSCDKHNIQSCILELACKEKNLQTHMVAIIGGGMDVALKRCGSAPKKTSHFRTASNSFLSKTWKQCGNAIPTRSSPTTPWIAVQKRLKTTDLKVHLAKRTQF